MTIQYIPQMSEDYYKDCRYDIILSLEEKGTPKLSIYTDNPNGGYATIGAGFKIDSNWDEILDTLGFDTTDSAITEEKRFITRIKNLVGTDRLFTTNSIATLQSDINKIMVERHNFYNDPSKNYYDPNKRTSFTFSSSSEVEIAFQKIAQVRDTGDNGLSDWLGETTPYSIVPMSYERIALLSRKYNNALGEKGVKSLLGSWRERAHAVAA